jgi:D-amino-acid dehydrogenase
LQADGVQLSMWSQGLLFAFLDAAGAARQLEHLRPLVAHGYAIPDAPLTGEAVRRLEPALSDRVQGAFLLAGERHVDPATLTQGLAARLLDEGVTIHTGLEVDGFDVSGRRVTAVRTPIGQLPADHVLLAAGAWTGRLARRLGVRIPLEGGKGYSFHIRPARVPRHPLYLGEAKAAVSPLGGGRVRIAGTMELSGLNLRLDRRRIDALSANARGYLAQWPEQPIADPWVGMRPVAPDGLPIVGRVERYDNVFLSTAHNMLGVTLAPATGEQLAELVMTGSVPAVLQPFSPRRFRA